MPCRDPDRIPILGKLGALTPTDLLQNLLSTMPDGLYAIDEQGRITCWNPTMEELTGYAAEEVLGQTCLTLEGTTCRAAECAGGFPGCSLFADGEVRQKRCRIRRKDGVWIDVVKNARLLHGPDGSLIGGIETVTDITEQAQLEAEVERLRGRSRGSFHGIVGRHPNMERLYELVRMAAPSDSSVLISGETGTGKELVAAAVHRASPRADGPLIRVSCAALSPGVLESELFGHVRGAFTGAVSSRAGRFEAAHGGTLVLDEIGDVPLEAQTKLLRVLQEREFERVGSTSSVQVDVRVVAATNRDLVAMCQDGSFRHDLYYRLAVIPLVVPPLRERITDLPLLVQHFIERFNHEQDRTVPGITADAMDALSAYRWPGNVRELQHVLEYAFVVSRSRMGAVARPLDLPDLPVNLLTQLGDPVDGPPAAAASPRRRTRRGRSARPSEPEIMAALHAEDGHRERAAAHFGVSRMTLWKWMRDLELQWPPA